MGDIGVRQGATDTPEGSGEDTEGIPRTQSGAEPDAGGESASGGSGGGTSLTNCEWRNTRTGAERRALAQGPW